MWLQKRRKGLDERLTELAERLRSFVTANSNEARGCVVGEEQRKAACQGAAQAYAVAAEMIVEALHSHERVAPRRSPEKPASGNGPSIG